MSLFPLETVYSLLKRFCDEAQCIFLKPSRKILDPLFIHQENSVLCMYRNFGANFLCGSNDSVPRIYLTII